MILVKNTKKLLFLFLWISYFSPSAQIPIISSCVPSSGIAGSTVTISGNNFDPTPSFNAVYFGAAKATVITATPTALTVVVPVNGTDAPISVEANGKICFSTFPFLITFPSGGNITSTSFNHLMQMDIGVYASELLIADIDGDGKSDVITGVNSGEAVVNVWRNVSQYGILNTSSFAPVVKFISSTLQGPTAMVTGDINADGKIDIITANIDNTFSILVNNSTKGTINSSSFATKVSVPLGDLPEGLAVGDIDLDGRVDIVLSLIHNSVNVLAVCRNISTGSSISAASFASPVYFNAPALSVNLAVADIDGDGKPDVIQTNDDATGTISIFRNTATVGLITTSSFSAGVKYSVGSAPYGLALGDIDGDGKLDIVVPNYQNNNLSILRNTSVPGVINSTSMAAKLNLTTGSESQTVAIADLDGDAKPEVIGTGYFSGNYGLHVFKNISTPGALTAASFKTRVFVNIGFEAVAAADLDGDSRPELVSIEQDTHAYLDVMQNVIGPPITITDFNPKTGPLSTSVVISGTNFGLAPSYNAVTFNGIPAVITACTATSVTATVPAGATTGFVSVTTNSITQTSLNSFTLVKLPQTITFDSIPPRTLQDPDFEILPITSAGLYAQISSSNASVADMGGNYVNVRGAGITVLTATNAGNYNYSAATPVKRILEINKGSQAITFNPIPGKTTADVNFAPRAKASTSLPVTYTSSDLSVAIVQDSLVIIKAPGLTQITANQPGNAYYNAATSITQPLYVSLADPSINSFAPISAAIRDTITIRGQYFATLPQKISVEINGLQCEVITNTANLIQIIVPSAATSGPISVISNGTAVTSNSVLTITYLAQQISFDSIPAKVWGSGNFLPVISSSSGLPLTLTSNDLTVAVIKGDSVLLIGPGSTEIIASQNGNDIYKSAQASRFLIVAKANQAITFAAIPDKTVADLPFSAGGFSSSLLKLSYASSNTLVVSINGDSIVIAGPGSAIITATQSGNTFYNAAAATSQSVLVSDTVRTITGLIGTSSEILDLYPNPVMSSITFSGGTLRYDQPMNATITDLFGGILFATALHSMDHYANMSIPEITPGLYLIHVTQGDLVVWKRFVKK